MAKFGDFQSVVVPIPFEIVIGILHGQESLLRESILSKTCGHSDVGFCLFLVAKSKGTAHQSSPKMLDKRIFVHLT